MLGLAVAAGLGAAAGLKDKVLAGGAIVRVLFKLICTSNAAANGAIKAEPRRRELATETICPKPQRRRKRGVEDVGWGMCVVLGRLGRLGAVGRIHN